jgi:hypothetical protein
MFFSKKNILIPNVAEQNILILVEEKKIIRFRVFVMVFCFVQKMFFRQHELEYFFCRNKREIFFQN